MTTVATENSENRSSRERYEGSEKISPREREKTESLSQLLNIISLSTLFPLRPEKEFPANASLALIATKWNFVRNFRRLSREMRDATFNRFESNCFP